jgi:uncharacterized phage protein (TIGR01671 family)
VREIKFRICSDIFSEWITTDQHHEGNKGLFERWYSQYINSPEHNPVICQYTGLKDKNGKEIYEGDILEVITHGFNVERFVTSVIFEKAAFRFSNKRSLFYFGQSDFTKMSDATIIGNIHQHPELLK